MPEPTRADQFFAQMAAVYDAPGDPALATRRLASWLGNADQTVLLFLVLTELRTMNEHLATLAPRESDRAR